MIQLRLEQQLEARGESLYWLAKQTGVAYSTLWKLKTADTQGISYGVLDKLCNALECEPGDLFVRVPDVKRSKGGRAKKIS
jgi:putative transcriptional regulator